MFIEALFRLIHVKRQARRNERDHVREIACMKADKIGPDLRFWLNKSDRSEADIRFCLISRMTELDSAYS